jgi:hypothetical protein
MVRFRGLVAIADGCSAETGSSRLGSAASRYPESLMSPFACTTAQGYPVREEDMARLSPFASRHLGVHRAYSFLPADLASARPRPRRARWRRGRGLTQLAHYYAAGRFWLLLKPRGSGQWLCAGKAD